MLRRILIACLVLFSPVPGTAEDDQGLWQAVAAGGHAVLVRHALAPGTGDPPGFVLGRCETQRNLSAEGRRQARALGGRLRAHGLAGLTVYSSQWCRCLETARGMAIGRVEALPALNSLFGRRSAEPAQSAAVRELIAAHRDGPSIVLVTHQANIRALAGVPAASGEMVVVRDTGQGLEVLGSLR